MTKINYMDDSETRYDKLRADKNTNIAPANFFKTHWAAHLGLLDFSQLSPGKVSFFNPFH